ncbi:hypothetical protein EDD16DRAFT_1823306 [Pisolithus croceorrhizus]|nr:hypothetical protein EV401DRAFT_1873318 [Pisolithus croceorrhizus]KAI6130548.1 hypothetical protein EDD16DRAFT_1823306 [Pisolithus croceorrhizus]KAI6164754.1 hypothetical protein EDD17DRAFT_1473435 [Pisolithus thermaeus]
MCYPAELTNVPCPMCKVFKPTGARCPHIKDVCSNRALHPRHDVVHLRNAEVKSFNGCGYCKWARTNPPSKLSGHYNPGWPGCCRAPTSGEQRFVQAADWPTVSIVHNIPMPPEIKSILDNLASRGSPLPGMTSSSRSQGTQAIVPSLDRRNSGNSPTSRANPSPKTQPVSIPSRGTRSGGSPIQQSSSLTGTTPRAAGPLSSSTNIHPDHSSISRRQTYTEGSAEKLRTPSVRRATDADGSLSRRSTSVRPSLSTVAPSFSSSRSFGDCSPPRHPLPYPPASSDRILSSRRSALESVMAALDISSSSERNSDSGSSRGSESDATVISDGAFTDYLSDESEAELQRQAEAKAALVAQNQAEEQEFKAARQQLVGVGLRPPKSWNDTNDNLLRASSHAHSYSPHSAYGSAPYAPTPVAR